MFIMCVKGEIFLFYNNNQHNVNIFSTGVFAENTYLIPVSTLIKLSTVPTTTIVYNIPKNIFM
jgi:hypothetical protein